MEDLKNELIRNLKTSDDAARLFHGRGESFDGLSHINIDFFSPTVLITAYKESEDGVIDSIKTQIEEVLGDRAQNILLQKDLKSSLQPTEVLKGQIEENKTISENDLSYHLSLGRHQNLGFFLDMKEVRSYLKKKAHTKKVLNLFSYTGSFSVAAISGGASFSVNFDLSKNSLNTARKNHLLNSQNTGNVKVFTARHSKVIWKNQQIGAL